MAITMALLQIQEPGLAVIPYAPLYEVVAGMVQTKFFAIETEVGMEAATIRMPMKVMSALGWHAINYSKNGRQTSFEAVEIHGMK